MCEEFEIKEINLDDSNLIYKIFRTKLPEVANLSVKVDSGYLQISSLDELLTYSGYIPLIDDTPLRKEILFALETEGGKDLDLQIGILQEAYVRIFLELEKCHDMDCEIKYCNDLKIRKMLSYMYFWGVTIHQWLQWCKNYGFNPISD